MKRCPEHIVEQMHNYLDGDITIEEEANLREHLSSCEECREHMNELKETVFLFSQLEPVAPSANFTANVMAQLPKQKRKLHIGKFLRKYPMLTAAAMFLVLMSVTLFSSYGNDQQLSYTKQPNLVVDGNTVIVPAGTVVDGNLVVKNGDLRIEGEVQGDVTVIKGTKYMASTAVITGEVEEIDQAFDWLWYKIKTTVQNVFSSSEQ